MILPVDLKNKCVVVYVGTRKLVVILGDTGGSNPKVLRHGEVLFPEGFEKGLVCNLQHASASLEKLLKELLPPEAWEQVPVYVVLGNSRFKMYRFSSCEYYSPERRTITSHEVQSVVQQTRNVATLPLTESILQAIPESFLVNDMPAVRNPVGLEAERLGVTLQIYTMEFQSFRNIARVFETLDLEVEGYFPKVLPLSEAVLGDTEKQEGVMILDIADDATQLVLWKNGLLAGVRTLPMGGHYLTQCLAKDWNIEERDAEKVKESFATLDARERQSEELVPLVTRNEKVQQSIPRQEFLEKFFKHSHVWMTKILESADAFMQDEKVRYPHVLFTGGAVATDGFLEWAQKEFSRDGKFGISRHVEAPQELVRDPAMAPALGMFRWIMTYKQAQEALFTPRGLIAKSAASLRAWFTNYF
jgi:cell division protein FtsA